MILGITRTYIRKLNSTAIISKNSSMFH